MAQLQCGSLWAERRSGSTHPPPIQYETKLELKNAKFPDSGRPAGNVKILIETLLETLPIFGKSGGR